MKRHSRQTPAFAVFALIWRCQRLFRLAGGMAGLVATVTLAQATAPPPSDGYIDKVMQDVPPDDALQLKVSDYNAAGWPRSWRVDYSLFSQKGVSSNQSRAVGLGGFLDTPNYGALSVNANLVNQRFDVSGSPVGSSSTWRIDQRAMPLDGGWFANHSAGDINTVNTPLGRGLGRISLPTTPLRGVGGRWYLDDTVDLNASVGRTGLFNGLDVAGFETSSGRVSTAGGQFKLPTASGAGRSDFAFQAIDGRDIADSGGSGNKQNTQGFWASAAWEGQAPWAPALAPGSDPVNDRLGGFRVLGNVVQSTSSRDGSATGLWADAAWRSDRWRNTAGVFRFEPKLRWATVALASDLQGVYWQADTSTRQWQAGFTAELSDSVSGASTGATGRSAYLNLNGRYRLDTRNAVGSALSLRTITSPGQAVMLSWDRTTDWGQTQWRSDLANTGGSRTTRVSVDQSWPVMYPASFNTSLGWERVAGGQVLPTNGWIWGVLGSVSPFSLWSIDGTLRGAQRNDGGNSLNANVGVVWQPYNGWSLALRYTESRGQEPLSALVVSSLTAATLQALPLTQASRSVQLLLRYEGRAGSSKAPLGGSPGTGAGSLSGTVFFDNDANGRREASEGGVPGVTVILDRRYVTRTDTQGRYEFPLVAAGHHVVEISSDNVPLPWTPALREPVNATVFVRQMSLQDFSVQRDR